MSNTNTKNNLITKKFNVLRSMTYGKKIGNDNKNHMNSVDKPSMKLFIVEKESFPTIIDWESHLDR